MDGSVSPYATQHRLPRAGHSWQFADILQSQFKTSLLTTTMLLSVRSINTKFKAIMISMINKPVPPRYRRCIDAGIVMRVGVVCVWSVEWMMVGVRVHLAAISDWPKPTRKQVRGVVAFLTRGSIILIIPGGPH